MKIDPEVRREVWDDLQEQIAQLQDVMRENGIEHITGQISNTDEYPDDTRFFDADSDMSAELLAEVEPDLELPRMKVIARSQELGESVSTLENDDGQTGFLAYFREFQTVLGDFILNTPDPEDMIDRIDFQLPADGDIKIELLKAVKQEWTTDYAEIAQQAPSAIAPGM